MVTGNTNPSATKADITTVGYDDAGVQQWSKTFMGTFGSAPAYDTAAAISGAIWDGGCPEPVEYWGAYISGTSAVASDSIPPASDIITLAWGAMDGHPIWASSGGEPAGVRRLNSGVGADDRAFTNAAIHPVLRQRDASGLWVAGQARRSSLNPDVDFFVQRYDWRQAPSLTRSPLCGRSRSPGVGGRTMYHSHLLCMITRTNSQATRRRASPATAGLEAAHPSTS